MSGGSARHSLARATLLVALVRMRVTVGGVPIPRNASTPTGAMGHTPAPRRVVRHQSSAPLDVRFRTGPTAAVAVTMEGWVAAHSMPSHVRASLPAVSVQRPTRTVPGVRIPAPATVSLTTATPNTFDLVLLFLALMASRADGIMMSVVLGATAAASAAKGNSVILG